MIKYLILITLLPALLFAQPIPPQVSLPISLQNGGTGQSGIITTISTAGTINNQALTTSKLRFTGASVTLTGVVSDATAKELTIMNATGSSMTLAQESGSSTAANRFNFINSTNYSLMNGQSLQFVYDTTLSRWRVTSEVLTAIAPITKSATGAINVNLTAPIVNSGGAISVAMIPPIQNISGSVGIPAASESQNGYLSSTLYNLIIAGLKWASTGNHIYNTNSESILLVRYECSDLVTYATCNAQVATGCTVVNGNDCSSFGDEPSCSSQTQCTWDGTNCNGSYFSACTGIYRTTDGSGAKLQINSATSCNGTANSCNTFPAGSSCLEQDGCTSNDNTCPSFIDEIDCNNAGCSWFDCSIYTGDEPACTGDPLCTWSDPDCSNMYCSGDNSSCTGVAVQCNDIIGAINCSDQDGCTYGVAPAIRATGDIITTSATGTDKVVCIKSNGALGTCNAAVSGTSCTCS